MQGGDFEVESETVGVRLDAFLARQLGLSRAETRRLLARGKVSVDGRRQDASAKGLRLAPGARVAVEAFAPRAEQRVAPAADAVLAILAEGPGWLVLDKPAGMPVHPYEEDEGGTVLNFVAARHPEVHGVGEGGLRSGVVHRLDVNTSGALLVATEEHSWRRLRRAFRNHRVTKRYRAAVLGSPPDSGRAEVGLRVARHRPARVEVVDAERASSDGDVRLGRLAWQVRERFSEASLLEVDLETGFLHQVRATLAHLGCPVLGDREYGPAADDDPSQAGRQLLHAAELSFDEISATSPDPADFAAALDRLRSH
jgi:23S rRNA pseudouridine1911/1915/1917 synthase